jgi:hypothetical protein
MRKQRDQNGVQPDAEAAVSAASTSSGQALPDALMRKFESSLGADLSSVRIHTSAESAAAASAVGAKAYAMGNDIHFGAGQYDPSSSSGQHLLAHEVAHTVQQSGGIGRKAQFKLDVSSTCDSFEIEADHAADAMVAGRAATVSGASGLARKVQREPASVAELEEAGNSAQEEASLSPLAIDQTHEDGDRGRVAELIHDIDSQDSILEEAEREHSDAKKLGPIATNASTRASLMIFNDKLDVASNDTDAFAVQFRASMMDYKRLVAEASTLVSSIGVDTNDPLKTVGEGFENTPGLELGAVKDERDQNLTVEFQAARTMLNTAGAKMDSKLTSVRATAATLQGVTYALLADAAQSAKEGAEKELKGVRDEIAAFASGVGMVVKAAGTVAGLAGGGGAVAKLGAVSETGGAVTIDASRSGLRQGGQVLTPGEGNSAADVGKAIGLDMASLGDVSLSGAAEKLATMLGEYCNKEKIGRLEALIERAQASGVVLSAASKASQLEGASAAVDAAVKDLELLVKAYDNARNQMMLIGHKLASKLEKAGTPKAKSQAKGIVFLTDADLFMARATGTISLGEKQQANMKSAIADRKKIRGAPTESDGPSSMYYYRGQRVERVGTDTYRLERVCVTFRDHLGIDPTNINDVVQGGQGTAEGTGSAQQVVATNIETLKAARKEIQGFQGQLESGLALQAPQLLP